jgi:hypothetical protein
MEIFMMKKMLIILPLIFLSACASKPKLENVPKQEEIPIVPDFEIKAMARSEVISAIDQCESSGMRPYVEYLNQKTKYGKVLVPVNVHCNPSRKVQ